MEISLSDWLAKRSIGGIFGTSFAISGVRCPNGMDATGNRKEHDMISTNQRDLLASLTEQLELDTQDADRVAQVWGEEEYRFTD